MSASSGGHVVSLHIYDLTQGAALRHSDDVFGETVRGFWHTGVVVFGREYFFEGGITSVPAGRTRFGRPKGQHNKKIVVGHTDLMRAEFERWVRQRERELYGKLCYHLVEKNCNHFTNEAVQFLTGKGIPQDILSLTLLVDRTAIGRLFSPILDRFFGGWQWLTLKAQWRFRARLDVYWRRHLRLLREHPDYSPLVRPNAAAVLHKAKADPLTRHRRYLPCFHIPYAAARAQESPFAELTDGAQQRKLRVNGRPPPRVYGFGPGGEKDIARLAQRLRAAFAAHPSASREEHAEGLKALIARLEALPFTAPEGCYRNIDSSYTDPVVSDPRLPAREVACLAFMLAPIVAVWRYLLVTSMPCKPKASDPQRAERDATKADDILAMHEGPGGFFATPVRRERKAAEAAVAQHKDSFIAILDAVSRLCLEPGMAILILTEQLETPRFFTTCSNAHPEPPQDAKLRGLVMGKHGLVGDMATDFDFLPVPIQILVLRCIANCYIAHPSLGRVTALSLATTPDRRVLETLGLQGRNAMHNKDHPMLRYTAATLIVNAACVLNRELAVEQPQHAFSHQSRHSSRPARTNEPYGTDDLQPLAPMAGAAWVPEEVLHSTMDVQSKLEAANTTKLRNMMVRALSRRLFNEHDFTVQKRILMGLYHCCLYSESARAQLASVVMSFSHAQRFPDLETRYLARAVEYMSKSTGIPPPSMSLPGPVQPAKWHPLVTAKAKPTGKSPAPSVSEMNALPTAPY
eukprot:TRINITY_DN23275_c0_g1_i1.p1 TRINITY_DN23275_c0_g1~~TRINITY_DN23275_c0_g1_i1.p1  ORF type:complete len:746 (+),score=167.93 TRINITY_DN23275_c0_g1_i1:121-2358(+)